MSEHKEKMELAQKAALNSNDPSTKVGAFVTNPKGTFTGIGWNHIPSRFGPTAEKLADRNWKYPRVVHAEADALSSFRTNELVGGTIYSTTFPCAACALQITHYKIAKVVTHRPSEEILSRWNDSFNSAVQIFAEAGVEVVYLDA